MMTVTVEETVGKCWGASNADGSTAAWDFRGCLVPGPPCHHGTEWWSTTSGRMLQWENYFLDQAPPPHLAAPHSLW